MYTPCVPTFLGEKRISVDTLSVIQQIDWHYLLLAWKVNVSDRQRTETKRDSNSNSVLSSQEDIDEENERNDCYDSLFTLCDCEPCKTKWLLKFQPEQRAKANEAYSLFRDAQAILQEGIKEKRFRIEALLYFVEAKSGDEGIYIYPPHDKAGKIGNAGETRPPIFFPMLRQQHPSERNGRCISLCDFVSPQKDYVGLFAVTVHGGDEWSEEKVAKGDDYNGLLIKSVADRLAEATASWLHEKIRNEYWGYAKETQAKGIRPAFGYPSIPDLSMLFEADKILDLSQIGIRLTENAAMKPNASICAMHISHPQAFYFSVGAIGDDQREEYAKKRGMTSKEIRKWMTL